MSPEIAAALRAMAAAIRQMLATIGANENDGPSDYRELIEPLQLLQASRS